MNEKETQQEAAMMLLQRGISLPIPNLPFLRFFRKNLKITVQRIYCGTMIRLSELALEMPKLEEITDENRAKILREKLPLICEYCAIAIINREKINPLRKWYIAQAIRKGLTADQLLELLQWVNRFSQAELFTNTISLAATMNIIARMSR